MMLPKEIDNVTFAFPAGIKELLPDVRKIPREFQDGPEFKKWFDFQGVWFYQGLKNLEVTCKPGIDRRLALRHLGGMLIWQSIERF